MTANAPPAMPAARLAGRFPPLAALVLLLAALALLVPGVASLPPTDRDEARFVQATRQMHETGDYLDIRFQDAPRYKKPIGIYWLQALATAPLGAAAAPFWTYRLPSQAGAIGAVLLLWAVGRILFGRTAAFLGALLFAATILLGVEARLAKTDAALLALTLLAQAVLAHAWMRTRPESVGGGRAAAPLPPLSLPLVLVFWLALGFGVLVKGPIILMVVGLTLAGLVAGGRSLAVLRLLRPLLGVAVLLAVVLPWLVLIGVKSEGAFFAEAIGRDMLGKVAAGRESHGAPPGAYLVAFLLTAWPLSPFALAAAPLMTRAWRHPAVWFCLVWLVPAWLVFEAVPTKLPHYVLPLYPALALLAGAALASGHAATERRWARFAALLLPLLPVAVGVASLALLVAVERRLPAWADLFVLAAIFLSAAALRAFWRRRLDAAVYAAVAASVLLQAGIYRFALPALDTIWLSPRLAAAVRTAADCPDPALAAAGYTEPSLVLAAGSETLLASPEAVAAWLAGPDCRVAAVESRLLGRFGEAAAATGLAVEEIGRVDGFNYNRGRNVSVHLLRAGGGG